MESEIVFDPNLGTLKQQITTAKQTYLSKANDKYMEYADVFNASMSTAILKAVSCGQADTSYSVDMFGCSFSEYEKVECPQEFYDKITDYFHDQGITATIKNNVIEFTWN